MTATEPGARARLALESLAQEARRVIWEVTPTVDLFPPGPIRDRAEALLALAEEFYDRFLAGLGDLADSQQEQNAWDRDNHDDPVDDQ